MDEAELHETVALRRVDSRHQSKTAKGLSMNTSGDQTGSATTTQAQIASPIRRSKLGTAAWIIVALFVALLATGVYIPQHPSHPALKFLFLWFGGAWLGYIGVRLGDGVRKIFRPDIIVTSGGVSDAIWARMCWAVGPQCVGLFLGAVTGISILAGWIN
ncbi:hypothetical protein [Burkholderia metallica]|uniref:hypothetical protein n=1 Tax=Burkholderia metallica TaxID=488729 RepID=UPI00157681B0|nr:hypothetical protein [Burkholderia metallica]NTZ07000.1 hypothetical protein [Burkholderia metallica]